MSLKLTLTQRFFKYIQKYHLEEHQDEIYKIFLKDVFRKEKNKKSLNIDNFMCIMRDMVLSTYKQYSLEQRYDEFYKYSPQARTLVKYQCRYGDIKGKEVWDIYRKKQADTNSYEYKHKRYGWTLDDFKEYNQNRAVTLINCIKKHGEIEGTKIFTNYCTKQKYVGVCLNYFIKKYGERNGVERYHSMLRKKLNPLYCNEKKGTSMIEQEVIETFIKNGYLFFGNPTYDIDEDGNEYISNVSYQFELESKDHGKLFLYDGCIIDKHILIEFNGDFWHCNPRNMRTQLFLDTNTGILREDIIKHASKDNIKRKIAEDAGFSVYTIWEMDWKKDKDKILKHFSTWYNRNNRVSFDTKELFDENNKE